MAEILALPRTRALDDNGAPISGAKLYFYEAGTSTPRDTYTDNALTTAHANPVVADANGRFAAIYLAADVYKVELKTAADVLIWSQDDVSGESESLATIHRHGADTGSANAYAITVNLDSGAYALGQKYSFFAGNANTGNSTLNVNGLGAKNILKKGVALASGDIPANALVDVVYDGTNMELANNPSNRFQDLDVITTYKKNGTTLTFDTDGTVLGAFTTETEIAWTSLPANIQEIKILLIDLSWNTSVPNIELELGDSGGYESTGYQGKIFNQGGQSDWGGTAIVQTVGDATDLRYITIHIARVGGNRWVINGSASLDTNGAGDNGETFQGGKTLSAELDRVRIICSGGQQFDGGYAKIIYRV